MLSSDRPPVVLKYYLYRATSHPGFHYPIYTLFLLLNDLTFTQIGVIASIQSIVVVAGEVPTGYVGDRLGRRNSLAIASILFLISNASYLVATDFTGFLFVFVTLSLGHTFVSGSASAWLYDTLQEHDLDGEFTHISGRAGAISSWVMTVALISGGLMYVLNPYYPFIAGVCLAVVNVAVVLTLPKNAQYADRTITPDSDDADVDADGDGAENEHLTMVEALPIVREQVSKPSMRAFIVYMAVVGGTLLTADMYIQPMARDALQTGIGPLLDTWGVPEAATLGVLYAAFTAVSAVVSDFAGDVEDRFGVRTTLIFVPAVVAALYLLPPLVPLLAFPMFFVMKGGFALIWPISGRFLNDQIDSVGRATVLSTVSMLRAVAGVPFRVGSGVVADYTSTLVAVAALGGAFLVCTFVILRLSSPMHSPTEGTSPAD